MDVDDFVTRCEAAASWRDTINSLQYSRRNAGAATALRGFAYWASTDPDARMHIGLMLGELLSDADTWNDDCEYAITTYCLDGPEPVDRWLQRIRDAQRHLVRQ